MPPQPLFYGSVVNWGGNWPRDTFAGLFFSQVRFPISLAAWPQRCLCQHSKRCSLLSFLSSPSPQKSYLKLLPSYSLRWNSKELGFRLCPPSPGGCNVTTEQPICIEKHTWEVSVKWKWTLKYWSFTIKAAQQGEPQAGGIMSTFLKHVMLKLQGACLIRTVYYFTEKQQQQNFLPKAFFFLLTKKINGNKNISGARLHVAFNSLWQ